jgi:hypothetical protein
MENDTWSEKDISRVTSLAKQGYCLFEIAKAMNRKRQALGAMAKRRGIEIPRISRLKWTPEFEKHLIDLILQGLGSSEIAAALTAMSPVPVSRQAVTDAAKRLGHPFSASKDKIVARAERKKRLTAQSSPGDAASAMALDEPLSAFERRVNQEIEPGPNAVPFGSYGLTRCRFPLWGAATPIFDRMHCGEPVERDGYCGACAAKMFTRGTTYIDLKAKRASMQQTERSA